VGLAQGTLDCVWRRPARKQEAQVTIALGKGHDRAPARDGDLEAADARHRAGLFLTVAERASLRIWAIGDGSKPLPQVSLHDGGTLPDVDANGRVAYLVLDPRLPDAGRAWISPFSTSTSRQIVPDDRAFESSVSFAAQPQALLVAREALSRASPTPIPEPSTNPSPNATPSPTPGPLPTSPVPTSGPGGIWLLNLVSESNTQLSPDGWLPAWLP